MDRTSFKKLTGKLTHDKTGHSGHALSLNLVETPINDLTLNATSTT